MLRSHFEFAYVLYIIFISSVSSVSFGDFCSNDLPCHYPLICSISSKCICPISSSSSFWNTKHKTCLSCPPGLIEWKNEKCLLFIGPRENGVIYQEARNACLAHSTELLKINNHEDFVQFQYKTNELFESEIANAFIEFLNNGVWINFTESTEERDSYDWCDAKYENEMSSWGNCVRVMKKYSENGTVASFCIDHAHCNEKLTYICEKLAQVQDAQNDEKSEERGSVIGDIISNIVIPLLIPQTSEQPPPTQEIIYATHPSQLLAQASKSSDTMLYIGLSFGDFCSNDLPCHYPLICSNSSKCICPISSSSSFWNTKHKTCLSCPPGLIEWKNEKCLLFIGPRENGVTYQEARNACLAHSTELLKINNHEDFVQFQYKTNELFESEIANAFIEFLRNGVWINFTESTEERNPYDWCDAKYENEMSSWGNCVRVMKKYSKNDTVPSICINHARCNEKLPYICERLAEITEGNDETKTFENNERQWSSMVEPMANFVDVLLNSISKTTLSPEALQLQIHFIQAQAQVPPSSSSRNIILYIVLVIIIIVIIIVILFFCASGFLFSRTQNKDLPRETESSEIELEPNETEPEPKEAEPKKIEIPIETKPQPSTHSQSSYIRASFDTEDE